MKQTENPRQLAMRSLAACEKNGKYSNLEINAVLSGVGVGLSEADRALYSRLVYGVLERKITLDYIIDGLSSRPTAELDDDVRTALRMGLYQLLYMDRIPEFAAVSESVALLPRSKRGFVNAVLRAFLRNGRRFALPSEEDFPQYLSVKYSFPVELCRLYLDCYGAECVRGILEASNREPPLSLRANTLRTSAAECARRAGGELSHIAPDVALTESFSEAVKNGLAAGDFFVQDEASRVCTAVLGAKPGETVVDTCACPGGKTFSMALDMKNQGRLYAFDLHKSKLSLIERGAATLGLTIVTAAENDARNPIPDLIGAADRVLCDAPCSGLGVIAKKPEIRYKPLEAARRLPEIQRDVLRGASAYVRVGGILVYSTCTLNKAENEEVVAGFLAENPAFQPEPDEKFGLSADGMRTFFPHIDGCDGFFIAKMRKTE